ncbi:MAG: hypothetical protein V1803_02125 [Candidatus Roizmanbacteria bacterium]
MIPLLLISNDSKKTKKYIGGLINNNSFLFEIKPQGKEYSIAEIKNLFKEASIFHKETRVYFLENFQFSSLEAQNAFLKMLEEPPANTLFILSVENENTLIPTIRSRTRIIRLDKKNFAILTPQVKAILNKLITDSNFNLSLITPFTLEEVIIFFRERLIFDKKAPAIIKETLKLKSLLENNNLNPQLTIDHLLIFIWKTYRIK